MLAPRENPPHSTGTGDIVRKAGTQVMATNSNNKLAQVAAADVAHTDSKYSGRSLVHSASVPHLLVRRQVDAMVPVKPNVDIAEHSAEELKRVLNHSASAQRLYGNPSPPMPPASKYVQMLEHAKRVLNLDGPEGRGISLLTASPSTTRLQHMTGGIHGTNTTVNGVSSNSSKSYTAGMTGHTSEMLVLASTKARELVSGSPSLSAVSEAPRDNLLEASLSQGRALQMASDAVRAIQRDEATARSLQSTMYTMLAEENAALVKALHSRNEAFDKVVEQLAAYSKNNPQIEAEMKRLGALLESHNANAKTKSAEFARIAETLSTLRSERGELIAQSSAAVAESQTLKESYERALAQIEALRADLASAQARAHEESQRAARFESELTVSNRELATVQKALRESDAERQELAAEKIKLSALVIEAQSKESASFAEQRLMAECLAERRVQQLNAEAEIARLKESEGKALESLERAQEDLRLQAQRSQMLHERAAAATMRAEELEQRELELKEQLATALERARASETRAAALEQQLASEVERTNVMSRELEAAQTSLRAEAELRREAQIARAKAVRDQERVKKSQTKLGTEHEALLRRYDQLRETANTLETALNEEKQQVKELENKVRELSSSKDAYHQTLSELQRLTIRYQELQTVSNTQIMGLTDLRDRQAQQIEMLRMKLSSASELAKNQSEELESLKTAIEKLRSEKEEYQHERELMQRKIVSLTDSYGKTIADLKNQIASLELRLLARERGFEDDDEDKTKEKEQKEQKEQKEEEDENQSTKGADAAP